MSITLTYSGRLKSAGMIEPLLQELDALAEEHGWQYELTGPNEHALLFGPVVIVRGIHLTLNPKAGLFARFTLSFDQAGLLVNESNLQVYSNEKFLQQYMPEIAHPITRKVYQYRGEQSCPTASKPTAWARFKCPMTNITARRRRGR